MNSTNKDAERTLAPRLPYLAADEQSGVIWLKDGSATRTLTLIPRTCVFLLDEELEQLRAGLSAVVAQLPEGTLSQFLFLRERTNARTDLAARRWRQEHEGNEAVASSPGGRLLEARRQTLESLWNSGSLHQSRIYLTLAVSPLRKAKQGAKLGPLSHLAYSRSAKGEVRSSDSIVEDLNHSLQALRLGLESMGFEVAETPLPERIDLIYRFLNPERSGYLPLTETQVSLERDFSDLVSLTDLIETRSGLHLGRVPVHIGTLKSLPESTIPALLEGLASLNEPFALIVTVLMLAQTDERERLSRRQRLTQGMASGNTVRNLVAENQLRDVEETFSAMISSGERLLAASWHLIATDGRAA